MVVAKLQNIAEWEMTDEDIEVAIKLADKSGDGRIDYDEFIAFVFGADEPVQRPQHTGTNSVHPEPFASQIQAAPSQSMASALQLQSDDLQMPAEASEMPSAAIQVPSDAFQLPAEPSQMPSESWYEGNDVPSTRHAFQPQLPSAAAQHEDHADLSMRQQSMTDMWVASQTAALIEPADQQSASQTGTVYDNALYGVEVSGASQQEAEEADRDQWAAEAPQIHVHDQPGDDVRLRIQSDDAEPDQHHIPRTHDASKGISVRDASAVQHAVRQLWHAAGQPSDDGHQQAGVFDNMQHVDDLQGAAQPSQLPYAVRDYGEAEGLSCAGAHSTREQGVAGEPGGLQTAWHGDVLHVSLPSEAPSPPAGSSLSGSSPAASCDESEHPRQVQPTAKASKMSKSPSKPPRKLPPLSHKQLSQGVNRSRVRQQQVDRPQ